MVQDLTESPTTRKRRILTSAIKAFTALAALAFVSAFIARGMAQWKTRLRWYVSPPIDAQGRRVHVLVPTGWKPTDVMGPSGSWHKDVGNDLSVMVLTPNGDIHDSKAERWLANMRFIPPDGPGDSVFLTFGTDVCRRWSPVNPPYTTDGKVHVMRTPSDFGTWMMRAISFPGSKNQVEVHSLFGTQQDRSAIADQICRGMYVN